MITNQALGLGIGIDSIKVANPRYEFQQIFVVRSGEKKVHEWAFKTD